MKVKLNQIATKARQDKKLKFTSLIHHVNKANLAECYQELKRNKACGINGKTVEEYGKNLEDNLKQLVESMKSKQYRPKPVKRIYIPKLGKNEKRGLGIPSVEDKLVQIMLKKILEQIYEAELCAGHGKEVEDESSLQADLKRSASLCKVILVREWLKEVDGKIRLERTETR